MIVNSSLSLNSEWHRSTQYDLKLKSGYRITRHRTTGVSGTGHLDGIEGSLRVQRFNLMQQRCPRLTEDLFIE